MDWEGKCICPTARHWLPITAFSPETQSACSFTYLLLFPPLPSLPLHYWFTARGSSSSNSSAACHEPRIAMSSSFSPCSFTTALASWLPLLLSLLSLSVSHTHTHRLTHTYAQHTLTHSLMLDPSKHLVHFYTCMWTLLHHSWPFSCVWLLLPFFVVIVVFNLAQHLISFPVYSGALSQWII